MTTGNASAFRPMTKDLRAAFGREARSTGPGCKLMRGRLPCRRIRGEIFPRRSAATTRGSVSGRCEQVRDADRPMATRGSSSQPRGGHVASSWQDRGLVATLSREQIKRGRGELHRHSHESNDRRARRRDGDRRGRSNRRRRVSRHLVALAPCDRIGDECGTSIVRQRALRLNSTRARHVLKPHDAFERLQAFGCPTSCRAELLRAIWPR